MDEKGYVGIVITKDIILYVLRAPVVTFIYKILYMSIFHYIILYRTRTALHSMHYQDKVFASTTDVSCFIIIHMYIYVCISYIITHPIDDLTAFTVMRLYEPLK